MVQLMLCCGLILLICITSSKVLYKFGVPLLLIFIFLGMIFGIIGILIGPIYCLIAKDLIYEGTL